MLRGRGKPPAASLDDADVLSRAIQAPVSTDATGELVLERPAWLPSNGTPVEKPVPILHVHPLVVSSTPRSRAAVLSFLELMRSGRKVELGEWFPTFVMVGAEGRDFIGYDLVSCDETRGTLVRRRVGGAEDDVIHGVSIGRGMSAHMSLRGL